MQPWWNGHAAMAGRKRRWRGLSSGGTRVSPRCRWRRSGRATLRRAGDTSRNQCPGAGGLGQSQARLEIADVRGFVRTVVVFQSGSLWVHLHGICSASAQSCRVSRVRSRPRDGAEKGAIISLGRLAFLRQAHPTRQAGPPRSHLPRGRRMAALPWPGATSALALRPLARYPVRRSCGTRFRAGNER